MQQPITQQSSSPQDWVLFQILAAVLSGGTSQALIITTIQQHTAQLDQIRSDLRQVLSNQQLPPDNSAKLDEILVALQNLMEGEKQMAADLTALTTQVQANTDVEASAVQTLQGLAQMILDLKNDPQALVDLSNKLKGSADSLAAAIVASTPAAETPPPGVRSRS